MDNEGVFTNINSILSYFIYWLILYFRKNRNIMMITIRKKLYGGKCTVLVVSHYI